MHPVTLMILNGDFELKNKFTQRRKHTAGGLITKRKCKFKKRQWYKDLIKNTKQCLYCNCKLTMYNRTADHIVPVLYGGAGTQENIDIICKSCNTKKGDTSKQQFLRSCNETKIIKQNF